MGNSIQKKTPPDEIDFETGVKACNISENTRIVRGLTSRSASSSVQFLLTFINARYGKEPITDGFLKWWINPNAYKTALIESSHTDSEIAVRLLEVKSLDYEARVYKEIIAPLISNRVCPNFIRYLASDNSCLKQDLHKLLTEKTLNSNRNGVMKKSKVYNNLNRSIYYKFLNSQSTPAISTIVPTDRIEQMVRYNQELRIILDDIDSFNYLITEGVTNDKDSNITTVSLDDFLYDNDNIGLAEVFNIYFQIIMACYSLYLSGMNHNDLHSGNIWIELRKSKQEVIYVTEKNTYKLMTRCKVMLFDYDLSYCERLGDNLKIQQQKFINTNTTNEVLEAKDIVKVSEYIHEWILHRFMSISKSDRLISMFSGTEKAMELSREIFRNGSFLKVKDADGVDTPFDDWGIFLNHEQILNNVASATAKSPFEIKVSPSWLNTDTDGTVSLDMSETMVGVPFPKHERIYINGPMFYNNDGSLDEEIISRIHEEIQDVQVVISKEYEERIKRETEKNSQSS